LDFPSGKSNAGREDKSQCNAAEISRGVSDPITLFALFWKQMTPQES
jgi:hypothetical protein